MFDLLSFYLDLPFYTYCETGSFGPLLHPFNVLSCGVFFFAALKVWQGRDTEDLDIHMFMAVMLTWLGVTGMLWHGGQHQVALALDIVGMYFVMMMMVITVAAGILRWRLWGVIAMVSGLIFVSAWLRTSGLPWLPQNGGAFLPALLFLAFAALRAQAIGQNVMVYLLCAAYCLMFGLAARSMDAVLCNVIPMGTHFIWHLLFVAATIYIVKAYDEVIRLRWAKKP